MSYSKTFIFILTIVAIATACDKNSAAISNDTPETINQSTEPVRASTAEPANTRTSNTAEILDTINHNPIQVNMYTLGSGNALCSQSDYEYDNDGYLTKKIVSEIYGHDVPHISWEEYEYDTSGSLVRLKFYSGAGMWQPNKETPNEKDELTGWHDYLYDDNGNQLKVLYYGSDGMLFGWSEYQYDALGNRIKETPYKDDGLMSWGWFEYEYNENEIEKVYNCNSDGSIFSYTVYSYDELVDQFVETTYNSEGEIDMTSAYSYQYDENGRMMKETIYDSYSGIGHWLEYIY